ncbi:hypothetical protein EZV62_002272 [Acer yangbiense]|uniref:Uncharacterized protein n=1 Tax=Acer yangbiense TaxID=1000413 RepID=A0A5C7IWT5_9ROSI|nr:hypothetical protein EZV62_002272 [Acer yangbiense]
MVAFVFCFFDLENKQLQRECSWFPGTSAKLGNSVFGFPVVNPEEQRAPEKGQSSGGGTGTGGMYDPGIDPASFSFDDCRDSSTIKADLLPKDSNFSLPGGSSDGLDEMESESAEIPFTQLLNSYKYSQPGFSGIYIEFNLVDGSDSQESANSTTPDDVVDGVTDANIAEKLQKKNTNNEENLKTDNITTESSGSQSKCYEGETVRWVGADKQR